MPSQLLATHSIKEKEMISISKRRKIQVYNPLERIFLEMLCLLMYKKAPERHMSDPSSLG